ncbi:MAG: glutathione peroxidase [Bacteroidetes bacterium]|nr:glutathione peroxidase [Bacteroidota bacterium]
MKKLKYLLLKLFSPKGVISKPSDSKAPMNSKSFYDFKMRAIDGKEIDFSTYKGKKVLIVNTASECGYTPQYDELQQLHETHGSKLTILGFPANNFGGQEPGSNADIGAFCRKNFGVTFQLFEKSDVVGTNQNPLYQWLTSKEQNGWNDEKPSWNFCKYLVNEKGELVKFYSAAVSPMSDEVVGQL